MNYERGVRLRLAAICMVITLMTMGTGYAVAQDVTLYGHTNNVQCVAFSPDGNILASGSWDDTVKLWDMAGQELIATLYGHTGAIHFVAFSPDGNTLASGSYDNTIKLWDVANQELKATLVGHTLKAQCVAFSPDWNTFASGSYDNTVELWDVASQELKATLAGHTETVSDVAFSPDGNTLASSGGFDQTVKLWDVASQELIATLYGHTEYVQCVAFSPDGNTLASGSSDNTAKLWDVARLRLRAILDGHSETVFSLAFSPDGSTLASGGRDIKLWDVASQELKATLVRHNGHVSYVAFSPDGNTLASEDNDNTTIKLWDLLLPPVLSWPDDGTTITDASMPILRWQSIYSHGEYDIQISKDAAFKELVLEEVSLTQKQFQPWGMLGNGNTYYWRVSISKPFISDWSDAWSFTLDFEQNPEQNQVELLFPIDGEIIENSTTPTLGWQFTYTPAEYDIQIAKDTAFADLILEEHLLAQKQFQVPWGTLGNGNTYYWRVSISAGRPFISNWSDAWSFTLELEREPPSAFNLRSPDNGAWSNATPTFTWTSSADAGMGLAHYQLWLDGKLFRDLIPTTSYTLPWDQVLSGGFHTWTVKAVDKAANLTQANETWTVRVDASPPESFALLAPEQDHWTKDTTPLFEWQGSSDAETGLGKYQLYLGDALYSYAALSENNIPPDSNSIELGQVLSSGDYLWYVVAVDKVGYETPSVQKRIFHIDVTPPVIPIPTQPEDGHWTTNTTPEFQWNASSDDGIGLSHYQFWLDETLLYDDLTELTVALDAEHALSDGGHSWFIKAIDELGNVSQSGTWSVRVDTSAPEEFSLISPAQGDVVNIPTPNFSWHGTSDSGIGLSYYQLWIDGELNLDNIPSDRTTSSPSTPLTEGPHTWFVKAIDKLGNTVQSSETWTVFGEWSAPQAFNLISPANLQIVPGPRPALAWEPSVDTGSGIQRYELWIGGKLDRADIPPTMTVAVPSEDLPNGPYQWLVKAVDKADNVTASKATWTFITNDKLVQPTSTITWPTEGQTIGGISVLISGAANPPQDGELARVEVSTDGGRAWNLAENTSADFSTWEYLWADYTPGYHTLRSRAVDRDSNVELPGVGVTVYAELAGPIVSQVNVTPDPAKAGDILIDVFFISEAAQLDYDVEPTVIITSAGGTPIPITWLHYQDTKWSGNARVPQTIENGQAVVQVSGAADQLGNEMLPDESHSFLIDTQPPSPFSLVDPADGAWIFSKHPNFQWEATQDTVTDILEYHLIVDDKLTRITSRTSGAPNFELVLGEHTWWVDAVDHAGNVRKSSESWKFIIDDAAPVCQITAPLPRSTISDRSYLVQGVSTDAAGPIVSGIAAVEVSINDGDWQLAHSTSSGFGNWAYSWTGFESGTYIIQARAVDRAGNLSGYSEPVLITVDLSLPGIESIAVAPELAKPGDTVTITLGLASTAELNYAVSPAVIIITADRTSLFANQQSYQDSIWIGTVSITPDVGDGLATIYVSQVTDVEGRQMLENPSAGGLVIDAEPPTVQTVHVSPDPAGAGLIQVSVVFADATSGLDTSISPKVAFIPSGGNAVPIIQNSYDDLTQIWTGEAQVTSEMKSGVAVVTVQGAADRIGNIMPVNNAAGEFTVDTSSPVPFELVSPADNSWLKGDEVIFEWAASSDETSDIASYRLYLNDSLHQAEIPAEQTSVTSALSLSLSEGTHSWKVDVVDTVGNVRQSTSTWQFSVDDTAPQTTLIIGEPKIIEDGFTLIQSVTLLTLTADDGTGSGVEYVEYRMGDVEWIPYVESFTIIVEGDHIVHYRAIDKVGNTELSNSTELQVQVLPPWDVDGNGVVDISDLVLVGDNFGASGEGLTEDINGDGVVDITDLIIVASHFGETTGLAAPAKPQTADIGHIDMVENWLKAARAGDDGSELFRRGIPVLEHLLSQIVPSNTSLLPNFPNPFNPDTWMPYQLSEGAEVSIVIYDSTGRIVKSLDIGRREAGVYRTQDRAAHWDGHNEVGEPVASGLYFVLLKAGEYQQTRRIVLIK